jgi:protein-L-isoaspartate(D-aspartate) O-methyltransferase
MFASFFSSFCESKEDLLETLRARMVEIDLKGRDITHPAVLKAMSTIPRHLFVPERFQKLAYDDRPLPIGEDQTISQPYIVALMTQELEVKPEDKVLEIGTGSGYQAAVLSVLAAEVFTIEIKEKLAKESADRLKKLGYKNVHVKHGDGYLGWPEQAPFDAIIVTAADDQVPQPLIDQLKEGGRLIMPVGSTRLHQDLLLGEKTKGKMKYKNVTAVIFVPMTGIAEEN